MQNKNIIKNIFILAVFLLLPNFVSSETGDVLFNCTFDEVGATPRAIVQSCGGDGLDLMNSIAQIDSTGGHDGGKALNYFYPYTDGAVHDQGGYFWFNFSGNSEVTIEYWEKFDIPETASNHWNVKSIRTMNGNCGNCYLGGLITRHSYGDVPKSNRVIYLSLFDDSMADEPAIVKITDKVDYVNTNSGYSTYVDPSTYTSPMRLAIHPTTEAGTNWRKIRFYQKTPTVPHTSRDGVLKLWINDEEVYTVSNVTGSLGVSPTLTSVKFHPSDDYKDNAGPQPAFHHLYDDITIYDGYVPPTGEVDVTAPSAPGGLSVQ